MNTDTPAEGNCVNNFYSYKAEYKAQNYPVNYSAESDETC